MQPLHMDALVSSFDDVSDLDTFSIPFDERDALDQEDHGNGVADIDPLESIALSRSDDKLQSSVHNTTIDKLSPINAPAPVIEAGEQEEIRRPTISRSTYFRAKRNLKSHGGIRSNLATRQIGRPQKLDAKAEKLIQAEVERNPAAELKHLQALVLEKCGVTVSLSSISRRLKSLGCSPSQLPTEPRKLARKQNSTAGLEMQMDSLDQQLNGAEIQSAVETHHFDSIPHLEDYDAMQHAFAVNMRNHDLTGYTSDMNLDMLNIPTDYGQIDQNHMDAHRITPHIYKYNTFDKDHDLNDYSPALNPDIYRHADERQLLFDETDLAAGSGSWHEVLANSSNT